MDNGVVHAELVGWLVGELRGKGWDVEVDDGDVEWSYGGYDFVLFCDVYEGEFHCRCDAYMDHVYMVGCSRDWDLMDVGLFDGVLNFVVDFVGSCVGRVS